MNQGTTFLFINFLELFSLFQFKLKMLLFIFKANNLRLINVNLKLMFCQVFLNFLEFIFSKIEVILRLGIFDFKILNLFNFDIDFSVKASNFFIVKTNLALHFSFDCFQLGNFFSLRIILGIQLFVDGL